MPLEASLAAARRERPIAPNTTPQANSSTGSMRRAREGSTVRLPAPGADDAPWMTVLSIGSLPRCNGHLLEAVSGFFSVAGSQKGVNILRCGGSSKLRRRGLGGRNKVFSFNHRADRRLERRYTSPMTMPMKEEAPWGQIGRARRLWYMLGSISEKKSVVVDTTHPARFVTLYRPRQATTPRRINTEDPQGCPSKLLWRQHGGKGR